MITNLKVDIIYYKTSSDFEMEFNLQGCCRMRTLKDSADSKRGFVAALAKAVDRSRIIIAVSELLGEDSAIPTLCAAIGYKCTAVDRAAVGIKSDSSFTMPNGALPLVTKSGQFGGFIVECGKQSIILVSADRALRHEIMRSYIHQYVFDINQVEAYNERIRHEHSDNPIINNSNILTNARQEFGEVTEENGPDTVADTATPEAAEENPLSEEAAAGADETAAAEEQKASEAENTAVPTEDGDSAEPEIIDISSGKQGFSVPAEEEEDTAEEKRLNRPHRRRKKGSSIALLIIVILLLVCFGVLAYFFVYLPIMGGELPNDLTKLLEELL